MKIATFNVNSIRARLPVVLRWLDEHRPDILAIQETKTPDDAFPEMPFREAGWHVVYRGEKGYNGVAIISRLSPSEVRFGFDTKPRDETRLVYGRYGRLHVVNTYVPQGRDIHHSQYEYKLEWFRRLRKFFESKFRISDRLVWLGDLNVAAEPLDVHAPELYGNHVCFHAAVRREFARVREWGFRDVVRELHPNEQIYSFFDYRTPRAVTRNIGWRIDYILVTPPLADRCIKAGVDLDPRRGRAPSDHTVVFAEFDGEWTT